MQTHLFLQEDMEAPRTISLPLGEVQIFSRSSPCKDTPNADAAALFDLADGSAVLAVADGVGGQRGAEQASALTLRALEQHLAAVEREGRDLREAILNGLEAANSGVVELGIGAGTTVLLVELRDGRVRTYHVGDSQALLTGQRGRVKLFTTAHSPIGYALEAGVLEEEEALHHAERHLLSNMIGLEQMHIEMGSAVALAPLDTLILASDGLYDNLRLDEIVQLVRQGPADRAAAALIETCRARMLAGDVEHPSKPDDLTAVFFRLQRRTASHPEGGPARPAPDPQSQQLP